MDRIEQAIVEREAARDDRLLQELEHGACLKARRGHGEHGEECLRARVAGARRPAGDRVRNLSRARDVAEDRVDQGCPRFEVRQHDDDVRWARRIGTGEQREQLVLQDFELAGERVADVDLDAAIVVGEGDASPREIRHVEDGVLDAGEEGAAVARREIGVVDHRLAIVLQQEVDVGLRLLAPRRQQPVADFVMVGAAFRGEVREAACVDGFEPVLAARIDHVQPDVDPLREAAQDVEIKRWRGRQAEDVCEGGQSGADRRIGAHRLHRVEEHDRRVAAVGAELAGDPPPQGALPALVLRVRRVEVRDLCRLARKPCRKPVGPVGQVLLEQRRHARCELVAHDAVRLPQVRRKRRMRGDERGVTEDAEHAPGQHRRGERRDFPDLRHEMPDLPPQPLGEERKPHVRADAETIGRRELDPSPHARAGDDDLLGDECRRRRLGQRGEERVLQGLETVGEMDLQHAGGGPDGQAYDDAFAITRGDCPWKMQPAPVPSS